MDLGFQRVFKDYPFVDDKYVLVVFDEHVLDIESLRLGLAGRRDYPK